ncbi:hypothetical protein [Domibacillus aminovorans]|uniref:Uncharacterized protein n=1 Tax=Domibacillus aminovorans TaxID=29332 RepID=A0A177L712_9BACI|nr:hypothetical protein [Domibacillus aminovorans]OAH61363.1 hypothetical protein AWH49_13225 [Domibacillus aminovorans]
MKPKSDRESFIDDLDDQNDKLYLILRGHLYIENELNKLLEGFIPNPDILELYKERFRTKTEIASAFNLIDQNQCEMLLEFNELRNKYAHRLKYNISHQEIMELKSKLGEIEGLERLVEDIVTENKSTSVTDLKTVIAGLRTILNVKATGIKKCEDPSFHVVDLDDLENE